MPYFKPNIFYFLKFKRLNKMIKGNENSSNNSKTEQYDSQNKTTSNQFDKSYENSVNQFKALNET